MREKLSTEEKLATGVTTDYISIKAMYGGAVFCPTKGVKIMVRQRVRKGKKARRSFSLISLNPVKTHPSFYYQLLSRHSKVFHQAYV
jgi:hypothetical protein